LQFDAAYFMTPAIGLIEANRPSWERGATVPIDQPDTEA